MSAQFWYDLGLLLHIVGISLLGGGTFGQFFTDRAIWSSYKTAPNQAMTAARLGERMVILSQVGPGLLLISGLLLLAARDWAYFGQFWLTVKLGLFFLMFLNGILVAGPTGKKLLVELANWQVANGATPSKMAAMISGGYLPQQNYSRAEVEVGLLKVRQRLSYFHLSENTMLAVVLVLATFKFN